MCADMTVPVRPVGQHEHGLPEPAAVATGPLALIAAGALIFLAAVLTVLGAIYSREVPIKTVPGPQQFPAPRVETDEHDALEKLIAAQRQTLNSYGWANDQHTLVRIPIARAMALIAAKGQQAYDPVAALPSAPAAPDAGAQPARTPPGTAR